MSSDISSISDGGGQKDAVPQLKVRNVVRASPPSDTDIDAIENDVPEVTVTCRKCKQPTMVQYLTEHRAYHEALSTMQYTYKNHPQDVDELLQRRNTLVRQSKQDKSRNAINHVGLINDAYELLRSYIEGTYEERSFGKEKYDLECRSVALNCSALCIPAVGICYNENVRWKPKMEDTRVFQDFFGNDAKKCFFALYDGHNGRFAADLAANDFHHYLLNEMAKFDTSSVCTCTINLAQFNDMSKYAVDRQKPVVRRDSIRHILHAESVNIIQQIMHTCSDNMQHIKYEEKKEERNRRGKSNKDPFSEEMSLAFRKAYAMTDHALSFGVNEQSRVRWSGCSALTCVIKNTSLPETGDNKNGEDEDDNKSELIEKGVIYLANAGNSNAVLCRNGVAYKLTKDHSPHNKLERERVTKSGATIQSGGAKGKVNGILDATRGLGNHGDPILKKAISAEPYTTSVKIDQYAEFLILATNGLWEWLNFEEVVEVAQQVLEVKEKPPEPLVLPTFRDFPPTDDEESTVNSNVSEKFQEMVFSQIDIDGQDEDNLQSNRLEVISEQNEPDVRNGEFQNTCTLSEAMGGTEDNLLNQSHSDFESMVSMLTENDDGHEADVETVTEMQTVYATSQLSALPTKKERYRLLAQKMSERIVQAAILAGSKDNITVMAIILPGCQLPERHF